VNSEFQPQPIWCLLCMQEAKRQMSKKIDEYVKANKALGYDGEEPGVTEKAIMAKDIKINLASTWAPTNVAGQVAIIPVCYDLHLTAASGPLVMAQQQSLIT
jgi:hypothetical protein